VKELWSGRTQEDVGQLIDRRQHVLIFKVSLARILPETVVDWDRNFPEFEIISINTFERILLLVLDEFFEGADRLSASDFDWKDVIAIFANHHAVEVKMNGM
jgi:hypothetical protein